MIFWLRTLFQWKPDAEEFTAKLSTPAPFLFRMDRFPKGIDNAHVDVFLSPKLTGAARQLVKRLLEHELAQMHPAGRRSPPPGVSEIEEFRRFYMGVMEGGLGLARKGSHPELIQLLQFASLKFQLEMVKEELRTYREGLSQATSFVRGQSSGQSMQMHDRLVAWSREEPELHRRIVQKLMLYTHKLEATSLRKLRKSMLGRSWPVPKQTLFNPMFQLSSLWADDQMMKSYTLVGTDKDDLRGFDQVNRMITGLFKEFLPEWAMPPLAQGADLAASQSGISEGMGLRQRHDQGTLNGFLEAELILGRALREQEYLEGRTSWLDEPENMERIVRWDPKGMERRKDPNAPREIKRWQRFHSILLEQLFRSLKRGRFLDKILANREAPQLYEELKGELPVRLIVRYLEGALSHRSMQQRLQTLTGLADKPAVLRLLQQRRQTIRAMPGSQRRRYAVEFLKDFAVLRRDLKLAYRAYWIMNQIRLLTRSEDVDLSRSNGSLHEFVLPEERQQEQQRIRSHVIIKADVRGSTKITAQLREKNLNPASHFHLNFFEPINKLLERFGAVKVFVEGDAVILAIYEYENAPYDWLAVARACGLAVKILGVVDIQNAQNRKYGLPELELGLGITYRDESPAFLFDGDHEIMISPAINRADRLSGCAASLRKTSLGKIRRGVEVVEPVDQGIMQKDTGDQLLRYNVNGVELDSEAFHKLKSELVLHKVREPIPGYSEQSLFYLGRYPDRNGSMQWIVVREAPIRLWIGNDASTEEQWGRHFFEVISAPEIVNHLKQAVKGNVENTGVWETLQAKKHS
jgi:class 3 adenylate cyclase